MSGCEIRRASDGTVVRVNGSIDQETLDALTAQVKAHEASRCHHVGPHVMPEIAQRIHGRVTYLCGREKGHEGPHRHPEPPSPGRAPWEWFNETGGAS